MRMILWTTSSAVPTIAISFCMIRLAQVGQHGRETEGAVVVPLQLERLPVALQVLAFVAGTEDVHVAAAAEAPVLLGVPADLPAAAVLPIRPAVLLGLLVVDLDVALQARRRLGHGDGVDLVACRPANRALARWS